MKEKSCSQKNIISVWHYGDHSWNPGVFLGSAPNSVEFLLFEWHKEALSIWVCCFCVVLVGGSLIPLALIYMFQLTNQIINYPKSYWLKSAILLAYNSVSQQFGQGSVGWLFSSIFHLLGSFTWLRLVGGWASRFKKTTCMSGTSGLLHMGSLSTQG